MIELIDIQGKNVCLMCGRRTDEPFCEGEEKPHPRVPTCIRWNEDWLKRIHDEADLVAGDRSEKRIKIRLTDERERVSVLTVEDVLKIIKSE